MSKFYTEPVLVKVRRMMKKSTIIVLIAVAVLIVGAGVTYYFAKASAATLLTANATWGDGLGVHVTASDSGNTIQGMKVNYKIWVPNKYSVSSLDGTTGDWMYYPIIVSVVTDQSGNAFVTRDQIVSQISKEIPKSIEWRNFIKVYDTMPVYYTYEVQDPSGKDHAGLTKVGNVEVWGINSNSKKGQIGVDYDAVYKFGNSELVNITLW